MGAGGSPPLGPKPSAIPSHMLNGSSPLHPTTGVRDERERESLNSSIRSSFAPRVPAEFNSPEIGSAVADESSATGVVRNPVIVRYAPSTLSHNSMSFDKSF